MQEENAVKATTLGARFPQAEIFFDYRLSLTVIFFGNRIKQRKCLVDLKQINRKLQEVRSYSV